MIDAVKALYQQSEDRLNLHIGKLRPVVAADSFDSVCARYREAFPDIIDDPEGMRRMFTELCAGDVERLKMALLAHSDLRLPEIHTFSLDDAVRAYGEESGRAGFKRLLTAWSLQFGDLGRWDPKRFLLSNPVPSPTLHSPGRREFLLGVVGHICPHAAGYA